jgi:hypothetical protein
VVATYPGATTFPGRGTAFGLDPDSLDTFGLTAVQAGSGSLLAVGVSVLAQAAVQPSAATDPGSTTFPVVFPGRGTQIPSVQPSIPTLAVTPV